MSGIGVAFLGVLLQASQQGPVTPGPEGRRAYDDLGGLYAGRNIQSGTDALFGDLNSVEPVRRAEAGRLLQAYLAQSLADESNGRARWVSLPTWGGEFKNEARSFREGLAERMAGADAGELLVAFRWLVAQEPCISHLHSAMPLLKRLGSGYIKSLIERPPTQAKLLLQALAEAELRKLNDIEEPLLRLAGHPRQAVRNKARTMLQALGRQAPEWDPGRAFTPEWTAQLDRIKGMVWPSIEPAGLRRFLQAPLSEPLGKPKEVIGWQVREENGEILVHDWFGRFQWLIRDRTNVRPTTLQAEAGRFRDLRPVRGALSHMGDLSVQFEAPGLSAPEILLGVRLFHSGELRAAADVLLPCLESIFDDRDFPVLARDLLGHALHQTMLTAYVFQRDDGFALEVARHLARPAFDGYFHQDRALQLARQLERDGPGARESRLPRREEWSRRAARMSREQQIDFLASQLRWINAYPQFYPGQRSFFVKQESPQNRWLGFGHAADRINPFLRLCRMGLSPAELSRIVPYLAQDDFMPSVEIWRDFHPAWHLDRIWRVAADLINLSSGETLVSLEEYAAASVKERNELRRAVVEWCEKNGARPGRVPAAPDPLGGPELRRWTLSTVEQLIEKAKSESSAGHYELVPVFDALIERGTPEALEQAGRMLPYVRCPYTEPRMMRRLALAGWEGIEDLVRRSLEDLREGYPQEALHRGQWIRTSGWRADILAIHLSASFSGAPPYDAMAPDEERVTMMQHLLDLFSEQVRRVRAGLPHSFHRMGRSAAPQTWMQDDSSDP